MIILNNKEVYVVRFPNGETNIDIEELCILESKPNIMRFKFETNEDLITLMFLKKHLDEYENGMKIALIIDYMPYSRMDRKIEGKVFTLKYISEFLNNLNFNQIYVHEPHSDVSIALLNSCHFGYTTVEIAKRAMEDMSFNKDKDYVLFPDAGAQKRYGETFSEFKTLIGFKTRDLDSGKIESLAIYGDGKLEGNKVLIIDDLCSRGETFMRSAEAVEAIGGGDTYLAVTHLENNVLTGYLPTSHLIKGVYASESICTRASFEKLTLFNLEDM